MEDTINNNGSNNRSNNRSDDEIIKRACGAITGALVGDAFGGRYEFSNGQMDNELFNGINNEMYKEYVPILGGGIWNLVPGQITDDSELTLTLASALVGCNRSNTLVNQESIASAYRSWYMSEPFDIGNTTRTSFCQKTTHDMLKASQELELRTMERNNDHCLSNGMLMRISPIGILVAGILKKFHEVYFHENKEYENELKSELKKIKELVKIDTQLTHPSEEAIGYATAYVILLAYSILHGHMIHGCHVVEQFLEKDGDWYEMFRNGLSKESKLAHDPKDNMGDSRIAFQLAVRKANFIQNILLGYENGTNLRSMDITEAIVSTVKLGGDTDTNACIVGALCGAIVGKDEIPIEWINIITSRNVVGCARYKRYKINKLVLHLDDIATELFSYGYAISGQKTYILKQVV